ncbi:MULTISPECIES: DUF3933 family protein [Bacillus cereus group]|uniref:DUF3933 domain-containing protein n=1 Tax=Bacillus cereus TaxID=1396 RepID=A0A2B1IPH8_BACCE|nr:MULTISPECIES: DUF3933 family protein [Bacillus cereus group]EEL51043.1 hypothetical protein bcere0022_16180 [Bacillus cereus Rock3-44]PFA18609.1 DUF3933 domain-containing protein [Bacillus cereus]PFK35400.1 DUF3933 domain-containing protein [Bacillus cereus]PFN02160.1 DUF3933 domain-containing protein [Bacillus cereus]PFO84300.1 DUF3933 domain-containing protein [Bacillus cereus]
MKQYVICQVIDGMKYLAAYAETRQEAIEKAELLGLRTGGRYVVVTAEEAEGLQYP